MNAMGGAFEDWTKAVEAATAEADAAMASPLRAVSTEKNLDWTFIIPPRIRRSVSRSAARVIPPGSTGAGIMFVGVDDEEVGWTCVVKGDRREGKHIAFAHTATVWRALFRFGGQVGPLQIHFGSKVF
jgi:hypothetical protein